MNKITIDEKEYDISNPSIGVKAQLENLRFVDDLLNQKKNELQVAHTAQIGYSRALNRELQKTKKNK
tara:strand:- start:2865 stop:3065 length:201 start_codon:yes stop_codon:yes gene_type:complete